MLLDVEMQTVQNNHAQSKIFERFFMVFYDPSRLNCFF